jgi:hypothetical protein
MAKATVRYKGLSDVREMTVDQLKAVGIDVPEDLVWFRGNGFKQEVELTEDLERLFTEEGTFIVETATDSGESQAVVEQTKSDDTVGATIVDAETGQVSEPQ